MRYQLTAAIVVALVSVAPCLSQAQTPVPPPPVATQLVLPIELLLAKPNNMDFGLLYFERVGLAPREFRVGTSPHMTGATWASMQVSGSGKKVVAGRTVSYGNVTFSPTPTGQGCGSNRIWVRAWLQLRAADPSGRVYVSNVKGDSTCVALGG